MFQQIKTRKLLYRLVYYFERRTKETVLDCHMCGQCVARSTSMICPMQCPKQLRNGPCGGSMDGKCEVYTDRPCIWTKIHTRADRFGWMRRKLTKILPALDWRLYGSSALLNLTTEHKIDKDGRALSHAPKPRGNRWAPHDEAEAPAAAPAATDGAKS